MKGKIINEENKLVAYSHIGVEGTRIGAISNEAGEFSLDISDMSDSDILVISSIGYESQRFNYNHLPREGKLDIVLKKKYIQEMILILLLKKLKKRTLVLSKIREIQGGIFLELLMEIKLV